jgi:uncharacterized protein DUF1353
MQSAIADVDGETPMEWKASMSGFVRAPRLTVGAKARFCLFSFAVLLTGLVSAAPVSVSAEEPFPCSSCFIGELKLSENPADPSGRTRILAEDLYFIDLEKTAWKAGKGDETDGASIPPLFQPIIGGPWEKDYLPAAVMHDHYANPKHLVRPWWTTDRMFYQAMLVREVGFIKASLMYYAVYVFGPHWDKLGEGEPCGPRCTFIGPETYQSPDYDLSHAPELKEVEQLIKDAQLQGTPLTLSELEKLGARKHQANVFLGIRERNR